jgi:hypothetical protein
MTGTPFASMDYAKWATRVRISGAWLPQRRIAALSSS